MDWQDLEDDREKYAAYLCSREWSVLKAAVHLRSGGVCERCKRNDIDAVHHLTYARKYREELADLQGLCNGCHMFTHAKSDVDPALPPAAVRIVQEGDRLVFEVSGKQYDLGVSIGLSLLHGLIRIEDVRKHIEFVAECAEHMRKEGLEAKDGR
jgi:hypothetical protein